MSPSEQMSRRDELEALLPFYINGTLQGDDLAAGGALARGRSDRRFAALAEAEGEFSETAGGERGDPPAGRCAQPVLESAGGRSRTGAGGGRAFPARQPAFGRFMAIPAGVAWAAAAIAIGFVLVQAVMEPERGSAAKFKSPGRSKGRNCRSRSSSFKA